MPRTNNCRTCKAPAAAASARQLERRQGAASPAMLLTAGAQAPCRAALTPAPMPAAAAMAPGPAPAGCRPTRRRASAPLPRSTIPRQLLHPSCAPSPCVMLRRKARADSHGAGCYKLPPREHGRSCPPEHGRSCPPEHPLRATPSRSSCRTKLSATEVAAEASHFEGYAGRRPRECPGHQARRRRQRARPGRGGREKMRGGAGRKGRARLLLRVWAAWRGWGAGLRS